MFVLVCLETGKVHNLADLQIYANLILKLKMKVFWWFTTTDTYRLPWKMSNKNIFTQAHQDTSWLPDIIIPNVFSTCSSRCLLGIHKLSGSPQNCQQAQSGQKSQNQEGKKWNLHVLGSRIILLECHIFIYCLFFQVECMHVWSLHGLFVNVVFFVSCICCLICVYGSHLPPWIFRGSVGRQGLA